MNRLLCCLIIASPLAAQEPNRAALDHFEAKVRPLLIERCVSCHGPKKQESGLRLDRRASAFKEHDFGKAVVAGQPEASRLLDVLRYSEDDIQMPPSGKIAENEIRLLEDWIKSGAAWPEDGDVDDANPNAWKQHWAFQPIGRPTPPNVGDDTWVRTSVDKFIAAKLIEANLKPQPIADARTQVRRLYFDLVGLPPTFEQVRRFADSPTDETFEAIVDELLASPHFGERWARHWMDVARYSDTTGYLFANQDRKQDSWKYRDWLIDAFNSDMPIDEFLIQQIAVDRILPDNAGDKLAATGFLTLGRRFLENKHDIIDDRIDVVTRGMMGFTVTCARCHDHKYDPIPAADYYSLYGVFASSAEVDRKKTSLRLFDKPKPYNPYVFKRGKAGNRGKNVPRRFLSALAENPQPFKDGSGRLELARAVASPENPLTARVFVNRVWSHLVGSYFVDTPSDFGVRSAKPTHLELLDHLAGSFIDNGWSLKQLIRSVVVSSVYRQRSATPVSVDPENRLLSRMNRKRLEFEAQRDGLLAVAGKLDRTVGGESVDITKAPYPTRRTVYSFIDRQNLPGVFRAFDLASPDTHAPRRYETTVPQQGLFQLNSPFVLQQAKALSDRTSSISDTGARVFELFKLIYSREPSDYEVSESLSFIANQNVEPFRPGWQYGYGSFDADSGLVKSFTRYRKFKDKMWRGGDELPDPKLGWSLLRNSGGHPGEKDFSAIRRWISPEDGRLTILGSVGHKEKQGDGIIARVVSNRTGQLREWTVARKKQPVVIRDIYVRRGEIIDFVVESGATLFHDSFDWNTRLELNTDGRVVKFNSFRDFSGDPFEMPLDTWSRYAQVLLLANEFVFID